MMGCIIMTKNKIWIIALVVLAILAAGALWALGFFGGAGIQPTEPVGEPVEHIIEVCTEGGLKLEGVGVYVYTDSTQTELVWFAKTDANGQMRFTDVESAGYVAVLTGLPEGVAAEEMYPLNGATAFQILLKGGLTQVEDLETVSYQLGNQMHDFTVTTADGTEYTISELLKTKKAVILNFWYIQCVPCQQEFPFMQQAYELYRNDIEILAMNPVNQEPTAIEEFREEMSLGFPMMNCEPEWEKVMGITAYPTTVVVDRYGTIALIHTGTIPDAQTFVNIFDFFASENYQQMVVENVEDLPQAETEVKEEGTIDNPTEVGGVKSFQVTVKAGEEIYVNLYKANNLYLSVKSDNVYIKCNGVTYKPGKGSVGFVVSAPDTFTPVKLTIGNTGKETETFTINLSQFEGTLNNPFKMSLGDFSTSVNAGNDQGIYYTWTAPGDGVLTMKCIKSTPGVKYNFSLYNQTSMAFRNLDEDGNLDENGYSTVQVQVKKGHKVQFSVGALPDAANNYPAGSFNFRATFDEGAKIEGGEQVETMKYTITVTDADRNPIPGVFFNIKVDGKVQNIGTNEDGVARITLPVGSYEVALVTPTGYKASTTAFTLTEAWPTFSVKLDSAVVITREYKVRVVDEANAPISGALVSIDTSFGYTDEKGELTLTLPEGQYVAMVTAEGYASEATGYAFPEGAAEMTVVLKPGEGAGTENDPNKPDYTVKVVDYFGKPAANVVVQYWKGEEMVGTDPVDATGTAMVELEPGAYTVKLLFSGAAMYYDDPGVLTAEKPEVTVTVIPGVSGKLEELYVGNAFHVTVGGTYVQMQSNVVNYYIFTPERSGVYQFTTSNPKAQISYWGANTVFIQDMTSSTDWKDNAFTRNVKESQLGNIVIIGITGASECVLEINRIGDAEVDPEDVAPIIYKGTHTPSKFKLSLPSGKKLINVDVTASTGAYNLVYNESDGFYHLGSASGPVMYVNLGENAPYVSLYKMLGYTGHGGAAMNKWFYDDNGKFLYKEDYTDLTCQYVEARDSTYGVYPLTKDLAYILRNGGEFKGWWDASSPSYVFTEVTNLNTEIAWMFACCYIG